MALFTTIRYMGTIDGMRMIDVTNAVVLEFFDRSLKGKPVRGELFTDIPDITVRQHTTTAADRAGPYASP